MEKIYISEIRNAETNELLVKVSSYSQEGLEEEMGKTKFTKFANKDFDGAPDFLQPEKEELEAANEELEWAAQDEHKREEQ